MSLQIWLPLNGSMKNQGLCGVSTINQSNGTFVAGKLGQCLHTSTTRIDTNLAASEWNYNINSVSLAGWFKFNQSEISTILPQSITNSTASTPTGTLIGYNSYGGLALSWRSNNIYSSGNFSSIEVAGTLRGSVSTETSWKSLNFDQWYHLCLTFDINTKKMSLYIDGTLFHSYIYSGTINNPTQNCFININTIWGGNGPSRCIPFYVNDIRIYDHCLSAKEVKIISQGLVLHYPLNDRYIESTTNLITSEDCLSSTCFNGATQKYSYGTTTDMYKTVTTYDGKKGTKVYMGTNGNPAFPYVYISNLYTSNGTNAPEYKTLSFDYFSTISTALIVYKLGNGSGTGTYKVINSTVSTGTATNTITIPVEKNTWNHIELTLHGTTDANAEWGYIQNSPSHTSNTSNFWFYANMQLETKDHATPYVGPGESRNETIIYDTSGYCNNGTARGALATSNDTSKYDCSTEFNGTDNTILVPYDANIWQTNFTINIWFKKNELGTKNYETLFGGPSGFEMDTRSNSATTLTLFMASARGGNITGNNFSSFNFSEWYMVTLVNDGTNELYYVNGNFVKSITKKSMPVGQYYIGSWYTDTSQNYKGLISDFRIYATALSAEDIAELYSVGASIDNQGNIYSAMIQEV